MLLGVSLIVGCVIAGFGALVLTAAGALPESDTEVWLGAAVAVVVAAVLGGLAGWLAFSSHAVLDARRRRDRGVAQIGSMT